MSDLLTVYDDDQANTFIECMVNPSYFDRSAQKQIEMFIRFIKIIFLCKCTNVTLL